MTWVTPSPESMTVPVRVRSDACFDVHDAASANTACTHQHITIILYLPVIHCTQNKQYLSHVTLACKDKFYCHLKTHFLISILIKSLNQMIALFQILFHVFYRGIVVRLHWVSLSWAEPYKWLTDWLTDWSMTALCGVWGCKNWPAVESSPLQFSALA